MLDLQDDDLAGRRSSATGSTATHDRERRELLPACDYEDPRLYAGHLDGERVTVQGALRWDCASSLRRSRATARSASRPQPDADHRRDQGCAPTTTSRRAWAWPTTFGNGKTALKANWGSILRGERLALMSTNPRQCPQCGQPWLNSQAPLGNGDMIVIATS